jgi:hypothetical protein
VLAEDIGAKAEELEMAAKANNLDFVLAKNPAFLQATAELIADIEAVISSKVTRQDKPKKDRPDGKALARLLAACDSYSIDKIDEAIEEIERYEYEADGGLAIWLRENVEQMNFMEIVTHLSQIQDTY